MALASLCRRCTGIRNTYRLQHFTEYQYSTRAHRKVIQRGKPKDLYAILNVSPYATQKQVKDAYYKLSMKYHPDRNEGSPEAHQKFTDLTEAYSIIGQYDRRKKYDKGLLHHHPERQHETYQSSSSSHTTRFTEKTYGVKFNFDEFYKAHYSDALKRQREEKKNKEAAKVRASYYTISDSIHQLMIMGVTLMTIGITMYISRRSKSIREKEMI